MKAPSETLLRRSAWVVTLCLIPNLIVRAALYVTEHSDLASTWGAAVDAVGFAVIIVLIPVAGALIIRSQPSKSRPLLAS